MTTTPEDGGAGTVEEAVLDAAADVVDDVSEHELDPADVAAMERLDVPRRLLLVHAHPDDETLATGATIARYAAAGVRVTLVTCTRGEAGEVIGDHLAHLAGDGDALAEHRTGELAAACEALGVDDHRFLGADAGVRFRDSGMAWDGAPGGRAVAAATAPPDAFSLAGVDEAAAHLVRVLREVRPQVVVSDDPSGGYGHPDHVHAHRVTARAVELAAADDGQGEPWHVAKRYEVVVPASLVVERRRLAARRAAALDPADLTPPDPDAPLPGLAVPDEEVTAVIEAEEHLEAKAAALRAHATQVDLRGDVYALSNGIAQVLTGTEHFRLARGRAAPAAGRDDGRESDLFAGLA